MASLQPPHPPTVNLQNIRSQYLQDLYIISPHPDNVKGIIDLASSVREISKQGLFDYRVLGNVHVITASGVGGGSLIYSNVTLAPDATVYRDWPTQQDGKRIEDYFDQARRFIGVNKITTNAALSTNKLEKTKTFQEAGQALLNEGDNSIVSIRRDSAGTPLTDQNGKPIPDFDIDPSITDVPSGLSIEIPPSQEKIKEINTLLGQNSECERQGRCNLECVPGACFKKLVDALNPKPTNAEMQKKEIGNAYFLSRRKISRIDILSVNYLHKVLYIVANCPLT